MEPIQIILTLGNLITLSIAIAAFFRQNRRDSQEYTSQITILQAEVSSLKSFVNAASIAEMASMKQSVDELKKRLEKLDNDVEKKIDSLSDKMDSIVNKMQELLIQIAKK